MKWRPANDKPAKLLESYYCKVYSDQLKSGFKKTVLIALDGSWLTEYTVIEWLDETEPPSGANVLAEQLRAKNPYKLNTQGSRDRKEGYEEACLILQSLAQYNAVEPEKKEGEK